MLTTTEIPLLADRWIAYVRGRQPFLETPEPTDGRIHDLLRWWSEGQIPTEVLCLVLGTLHATATAAYQDIALTFAAQGEPAGREALLRHAGDLTHHGESFDPRPWLAARDAWEADAASKPVLWAVFFEHRRGSTIWDLKSLHRSVRTADLAIRERIDTVRQEALVQWPNHDAWQQNKAAGKTSRPPSPDFRLETQEEFVEGRISTRLNGFFHIVPKIVQE